MTDVEARWDRVLFIGLGQSAVGWYRCYLPAMALGADWVGLARVPPKMLFTTGLVKGQTIAPNLSDYDVVVVQQARGRGWLTLIRELQAAGKKVLYEVDDYLHGIRHLKTHDFKQDFGKEELKDLELCMRVCDGIITSTEYIARRYRKFNPRTWVCENGIDVGRYNVTRPPRPMVNVGWAGATGHQEAMVPWLDQIGRMMVERGNVCFVSIGQNFAQALQHHFPQRSLAIPFTMIDNYPAAMTLLDVAVAPAGKQQFFRGKSDLRWVEAGALGIPLVADPDTYPNIEHGVTGFHASTPEEARGLIEALVLDEELRTRVGANARDLVRSTRDIRVTSRQWERVFDEVLA